MAADAKWYIVHTYSGYENKVKSNIEKVVENRNMQDKVLEVKVPVEIVHDAERNKDIERLLYPGYVMVKVQVEYDEDNRPHMADETWILIRSTRGVTGFVGPDGTAIPLSDEEVIRLGVEKRVIEVSYEVGDTVNIIDEIFNGFSGVVQEIDTENNYVKVVISALFGKETVVELELDQVEKAEL